jgi:6-phosphofructokinase 1
LTAASTLGRQDESYGPHLVYVPEAPFSLEKFAADVEAVYAKHKRCLIAVSEGIEDAKTHKPIAEVLVESLGKQVERDTHGNVQLSGTGVLGDFLVEYIKKTLTPRLGKLRLRADTFGYLQRSFAGYASAVDQREARQVGRLAVQYAVKSDTGGSVVILRKPGAKYGVTYARAELKDVARDTKPLPRELINEAGNGIHEAAFRKYAMPLVGKLPVIGKLF